jgi:hypothetical protein
MPGFGHDNMRREVQHLFVDLLVRQVVEIILLITDLIRIAECDAQQALTARFDRDNMLACREYHAAKRSYVFLLDRRTDHGISLPSDLAIGGDVVGIAQIEFVDFISRRELVDLDRMLAFDRDSLALVLSYFDVASFVDLVAHDDILVIDLFAGLGIELAVFDPMAGFLAPTISEEHATALIKADLAKQALVGFILTDLGKAAADVARDRRRGL